MKKFPIKNHQLNKLFLVFLVLVTILVSLQSFSTGTWEGPGGLHSNYNNYLIFKTSASHLFQGQDLYILHPADHFDLYKYSPLFALLMSPFALMPDWMGIIIWNLINLFALIWGLRMMPGLSKKQVNLVLLISFFELIGTLMNEQSNALMSGLMVMGVAFMEKDKPVQATLFLMLSVYIKLFSLVAFMMLLFYPNRIRNILYSAGWFVIFALIPIIFTGWEGLKTSYISWWNMLGNDYDASVGFSVLGIMVKWFNYQGSRNIVILVGIILMILPLIKVSCYKI